MDSASDSSNSSGPSHLIWWNTTIQALVAQCPLYPQEKLCLLHRDVCADWPHNEHRVEFCPIFNKLDIDMCVPAWNFVIVDMGIGEVVQCKIWFGRWAKIGWSKLEWAQMKRIFHIFGVPIKLVALPLTFIIKYAECSNPPREARWPTSTPTEMRNLVPKVQIFGRGQIIISWDKLGYDRSKEVISCDRLYPILF